MFGEQFCPSSGTLDCAIQSVPPSPDHRPTTYWIQHTTSCIAQSKAPEDGQNYCPKHVELIWIYQ